ncbi:hypothetical protein HUE87_03985 [Candidatus Sulfurimonas marisnigri]|uniref:Uncharacterized protein n=1 Tax=Candidatus Sulfurimonas marisnigri TaxID=2740405 RepID=A0A7S7M1P8_9BACT|nr:hypothetical protein [Candidatus Sulfurimonas marisnigri]QOY55405.1 hypothetical protein HUE87_03985 [Candidatus Sulfurimonas marisnigri]
MNNLQTTIDSISFVNYTTNTLHTQMETYIQNNTLTKHKIETNNSMNKYLVKENNQVIFDYRTLINKDGLVSNIINFNGLKTYNTDLDNNRTKHIFSLLEYLSIKCNLSKWDIRQIDICTDINTTNDKVIVQKDKVRGNRIDKLITDISTKTQYIETIKNKVKNGVKTLDRSNMMMSAYLCDKTHKELVLNNNIDKDITRFEVKLLPRLLKKIHSIKELSNELNKYHVKLFGTRNKCNIQKRLLQPLHSYS